MWRFEFNGRRGRWGEREALKNWTKLKKMENIELGTHRCDGEVFLHILLFSETIYPADYIFEQQKRD